MNLEVVVLPCPNRIRRYFEKHSRNLRGMDYEEHIRILENDRFIATCYQDVKEWADQNERHINGKGGGAYFYHLYIGPPGGPWWYWEMPHGDMLLEDRLWIPIDMHEAFYVEVA